MWHWRLSNDAENSALITGINYIYITFRNSYLEFWTGFLLQYILQDEQERPNTELSVKTCFSFLDFPGVQKVQSELKTNEQKQTFRHIAIFSTLQQTFTFCILQKYIFYNITVFTVGLIVFIPNICLVVHINIIIIAACVFQAVLCFV